MKKFNSFENLKSIDFSSKKENNDDIIDLDNGTMIIHRNNILKYLEKYMCKNETDLEDTMWNNYGIFLKIID